MTTFDLKQAADFLKIHPETMRSLALAGKVSGAKIGRRWVFIKEHLVAAITEKYANQGGLRLIADNTRGTTWQSTKEKTTEVSVTTSTSLRQTGEEYANLLGLTTKSKHKNSTTNSKLNRGVSKT